MLLDWIEIGIEIFGSAFTADDLIERDTQNSVGMVRLLSNRIVGK
jgi:hypothetical protein